MPDLIAQGLQPAERWRKPLAEGEHFVVGRVTGVWSAGWDTHISRRHAEVVWRGGALQVTLLPSANNPIYYRGQRVEKFSLVPGEHFVIGSTTFCLVEDQAKVSLHVPRPVTEKTFARHELRQASFRDPDQRIAALARLPDVIATSATVDELHSRLMNVLFTGIPQANSLALVRGGADATIAAGSESSGIEILHWDQRSLNKQEFSTSARLVRQAIDTQQTVVHVWNATGALESALTTASGADWAFCLPLTGRTNQRQALYVMGNFSPDIASPNPDALRDDVKFAELVATTFSRLRDAQAAERRWAGLAQFLSPVVLSAIAEGDWEQALAPREVELTVVFCDLRGFTRHTEQSADNLFALLERVSAAMSVMTRHILAEGGVVGDFHGDAVMGFWGWPFPQSQSIACACRAAREIQREFEEAKHRAGHALASFQVGIGIASGKGVAGKIGSNDQVKVTAFGPAVNLAARLESLTKTFQLPILVDGTTAAHVAEPPGVRPLATVLPWGFSKPVQVHELLSGEHLPWQEPEYLHQYEQHSRLFQQGDWLPVRAWLLESLPHDPARQFLANYLAQQPNQAPQGWTGAIEVREK